MMVTTSCSASANRDVPALPHSGGVVTTGFALVIAVIAVIATFLVDVKAASWCLAVFAAFMLYFAVYSRHRLVPANSPTRSSPHSPKLKKTCGEVHADHFGNHL